MKNIIIFIILMFSLNVYSDNCYNAGDINYGKKENFIEDNFTNINGVYIYKSDIQNTVNIDRDKKYILTAKDILIIFLLFFPSFILIFGVSDIIEIVALIPIVSHFLLLIVMLVWVSKKLLYLLNLIYIKFYIDFDIKEIDKYGEEDWGDYVFYKINNKFVIKILYLLKVIASADK
jgi:hypothetical protein